MSESIHKSATRKMAEDWYGIHDNMPGGWRDTEECWEFKERITASLAQFLERRLSSELDRIAGPLVEALQRVWDEDECGFLISGTDDKVECVKCGKFATDSSRIVHAEDCSQGFIDQALATYRKERGERCCHE